MLDGKGISGPPEGRGFRDLDQNRGLLSKKPFRTLRQVRKEGKRWGQGEEPRRTLNTNKSLATFITETGEKKHRPRQGTRATMFSKKGRRLKKTIRQRGSAQYAENYSRGKTAEDTAEK